METSLALQPCRLSPELLQGPLPFDLYSSNGILLSKQGSRLNSDVETLLAKSFFRAQRDAERNEAGALPLLQTLFSRYGELTERWSCTIEDVCELKLLADDLAELCDAHSDVCVCMAPYLSGGSSATRHSFAVAIVALMLGSTLGWNARRQVTLVRAAMTMNLSLLSNHDDWAGIRGRLSEYQQMNVHRHPCLSADLLAQSPGTDLRWISAVEQHHENLDGSGYPLALKGEEIVPEARVLRVADTWCAMALHPSGRGRKPPRLALREMIDVARGHLDHTVFLALKKLMGAYPPGTLIRLANRETALVHRWVSAASAPRAVLSIISPTGELMRKFRHRDTTQFGLRVRDYAQLNLVQMSRLPWQRVWAQDDDEKA